MNAPHVHICAIRHCPIVDGPNKRSGLVACKVTSNESTRLLVTLTLTIVLFCYIYDFLCFIYIIGAQDKRQTTLHRRLTTTDKRKLRITKRTVYSSDHST